MLPFWRRKKPAKLDLSPAVPKVVPAKIASGAGVELDFSDLFEEMQSRAKSAWIDEIDRCEREVTTPEEAARRAAVAVDKVLEEMKSEK